MANTLQKRAKRISLVLTLAAVLFTVVDNYLYLCHDINITPVATPVIIILVVYLPLAYKILALSFRQSAKIGG